MPQFDYYSFQEQIIISLFFFFTAYFLFLNFYIIPFSKVIKLRSKINFFFLEDKTIKLKKLFF
jgi:hypothetical protein